MCSAFTVAIDTYDDWVIPYVTLLYYLDCLFWSCHGRYFLVTIKFGVSYFRLNFVNKEKKDQYHALLLEEWIKNHVSVPVL